MAKRKRVVEAKRQCFFCMKREATLVSSLQPPCNWPEPLPPDVGFAMCEHCARTLTTNDICHCVMHYVESLRASRN